MIINLNIFYNELRPPIDSTIQRELVAVYRIAHEIERENNHIIINYLRAYNDY